jgi:hypothetical protein
MFRWSKDHFELIPVAESEEWLTTVGLATNPIPEFDPAINRITESNGWQHLYSENARGFPSDGAFTWNSMNLKFTFESNGTTKYSIVSTDQDRSLEIPVLTFDPVVKQIER